MGVDLTLIIMDNKDFNMGILRCIRRSKLFDEITKISELFGKEFEPEHNVYTALMGDKLPDKDPYGGKLRYLPPHRLRQFEDHKDVKDNHQNISIWNFIHDLDERYKIILYWN